MSEPVLSELVLLTYVHVRSTLVVTTGRLRTDEQGEGVISAAIAVLVMAFLGALMWVAFKEVFAGTTAKTKTQVDLIGS